VLRPWTIAKKLANPVMELGGEQMLHLHRRLLAYYRGPRDSRPVPVPTAKELRRTFHRDTPIVVAVWPVVRFLAAIDDVRKKHSREPEIRQQKEHACAEDARIFLLLRDESALTHDDKARVIREIVCKTAAKRRVDFHMLEAVVNEILVKKIAKGLVNYQPWTFADGTVEYAPSAIHEGFNKYFRNAIRHAARDAKAPPATRARRNVDGRGDGQGRAEIPLSTIRGWKHQKKITKKTSYSELVAMQTSGIRAKTHRPHVANQRTLAQLEEEWPYAENTLRKYLRLAETRRGSECPRDPSGQYAWLTREWERLLLAELPPPKGPESLYRLARDIGCPLKEILEVLGDDIDPRRYRVDSQVHEALERAFRR
jgi:hypothetical protein